MYIQSPLLLAVIYMYSVSPKVTERSDIIESFGIAIKGNLVQDVWALTRVSLCVGNPHMWCNIKFIN